MLNRRHFLTAAGLVLMERMGSLQPISARGTTPVTDPKQIVVVGAGLAGLAAAGELHRHGHRVAILEARHRIGGRIWTSTQWQEMPLDLGATWIHGVDGNPLTELADRAHIDRVVTQYERSVAYHTSGRPLTDAEQTHIDTLRTQVVSRLRSAQSRETDLTVHQAVASLRSQFAEASDEARFIDFILNSDLEQEYSGSTAHLSAKWYDHAQEFEGDDALFVQGFAALPNFLAEGLQVQQGEVVKAIDWSSSPVRLVTQRAEYTADYVVLTLPLGVLQAHSIEFRPALPPAKQHAINTLGMGVLNKCYLRFAHVFWPADADWLEYVSAEPGQWTEWVSFSRAARWPVLLGFHAAEPGRRIEALSDQNIVASAMQTLRTIFGRDTPDPIDYQITRWASDPFARGSYSFNAIGTTQETRSDLAAPLDDVVFFAGEATESDHFGTAHGAYISGLRAAQEIIALES